MLLHDSAPEYGLNIVPTFIFFHFYRNFSKLIGIIFTQSKIINWTLIFNYSIND